MKISIVQPDLDWEDKGANMEKLDGLIEPLYGSTDIVVLPEMFSTGFTMNTDVAEEHYGTTFSWMKKHATAGDFGICGSYIVGEKGKFYNRFVFVSPGPDLYYDKRHLFSIGDEDKTYTKGNSRLVFSFREFRIAAFVCYDLRFPVWSRNRDEYDLAIYVSSWPSARIEVWNTLLKARAIENQCYVAGSNRVGTDGNGVAHSGMSQVINPRGEKIRSAESCSDCVVSAEISIEELKNFRSKFNTLKDADDFSVY
ncbi:MAG TPA: amidohydrolase [Bacteroidales bacterium]|nr:amidohydrolase [Bacteroidales bacterium]